MDKIKLQKPIIIKQFLHLPDPFSRLLWEGYIKMIVLDKEVEVKGKGFTIVDRMFSYGTVSLDDPKEVDLDGFINLSSHHLINLKEKRAWWPNKTILWAYNVKNVDRNLIPTKIKK